MIIFVLLQITKLQVLMLKAQQAYSRFAADIEQFSTIAENKNNRSIYTKSYLRPLDLLEGSVEVLFLPFVSGFSFESDFCFCFRIMSSAYRRQIDSRSLLGNLEYLGSGFRMRFASLQEVRTVLPSSAGWAAASGVMISERSVRYSRAHRWTEPIVRWVFFPSHTEMHEI